MRIKLLEPSEAVWNIEVQWDDDSPRDHFEDEETVKWVLDQIERGIMWSWCVVKVSAQWGGFTGTDYLGACSYSEDAMVEAKEVRPKFKWKPGTTALVPTAFAEYYLDSMMTVAMVDLNHEVMAAFRLLEQRIECGKEEHQLDRCCIEEK